MIIKDKKIFFSGIGGSGMSALASFAADRGAIVSGSDRDHDRNPDRLIYRQLRNKGISLFPQDGSGILPGLDLVVFTTAVETGHPERERATILGIPRITRPEFLAGLVKKFRTVAVAGTSGKSTTAAMTAFVLRELGLSPNYLGGGRVKKFRTDTDPGNALAGDSDLLVAEACESDGTIVDYEPAITVFLNLSLDHHGIDETAAMFTTLAARTRESVIINVDDENLRGIEMGGKKTFGLSPGANLRADKIFISDEDFSSSFNVGDTRVTIRLPGLHNVSNALATLAIASALGIEDLRAAAEALSRFTGLDRRFDIHLMEGNRLVVDDYAHNPDKIDALMQAVSAARKHVCYIFQPHGFGPTRLMRDGYIGTFRKRLRPGDHLYILPIFYAGGTTSRDVSSEDLAGPLRRDGLSVDVLPNREEIFQRIHQWSSYIVFGARDESLADFADTIAEALRSEDLAGHHRGAK